MGVVFFVLILLSVAIYLLRLLDQRTAASEEPAVRAETASSTLPRAPEPVVSSPSEASVSPQIVAVIGAALALAQAETEAAVGVVGRTTGPGTAGWYGAGLARQMASHNRSAIRRSR